MKSHKWLNITVGALGVLLLMACGSKLTLQRVDYSQPLETVVEPTDNGKINDMKHGLSFNINPIQYQETQDTSSVTTDRVHLIRNNKGFYFITAQNYNNVYVMKPASGTLKLHKKIQITKNGLGKPAFNQRDTYIQLIDKGADQTYRLTEKGIQQ